MGGLFCVLRDSHPFSDPGKLLDNISRAMKVCTNLIFTVGPVILVHCPDDKFDPIECRPYSNDRSEYRGETSRGISDGKRTVDGLS